MLGGTMNQTAATDEELTGFYYVTFEVEMSLRDQTGEEPSLEFVQIFKGKIVFVSSHDGEEIVGDVTGYIIQADRLIDANESLYEACDSMDQTVANYFAVFYNRHTGHFKKSIVKRFDCDLGRSLLIIDRMEIDPRHRGRDVGLAVVRRAIDLFSPGCGLVALQPFPMQFGARSDDGAWKDRMVTERFGQDKESSFQMLRQYWSRLGFRRFGKTEYYALNPNWRQPGLRQACPRLHELAP